MTLFTNGPLQAYERMMRQPQTYSSAENDERLRNCGAQCSSGRRFCGIENNSIWRSGCSVDVEGRSV